MDALEAAQRLSKACAALSFGPPVAWTYDPLDYAWDGHRRYLERYGRAPRDVLLLGMNPGPWGMGQTGVPFGDITAVREWMGITDAVVQQPPNVRPERPILGFANTRNEVSGTRLYGALREMYSSLDAAYERLFIANYCPLLFFNEAGQNVTPDKLSAADREPLFAACDTHLAALVEHFGASTVIGIGKFAEARAASVVRSVDRPIDVLGMWHPSPASPLANKEGGAVWRRKLVEVLTQAGIAP